MNHREMDVLVAEKVMGECVHVLTGDIPETVKTHRTTYKCSKCGLSGFDYQTDHEGRVIDPPKYSSDMREAWKVPGNMFERIFSTRQRFLACVAASIHKRKGVPVAWPDALFYLTPWDICAAAVVTVCGPEYFKNSAEVEEKITI